jgi:hypothetical protein
MPLHADDGTIYKRAVTGTMRRSLAAWQVPCCYEPE